MMFAFPVRVLMTWIYTQKTNTEYSMKLEDFFDLFISGLISIWLVAFSLFTNRPAENPLLAVTIH